MAFRRACVYTKDLRETGISRNVVAGSEAERRHEVVDALREILRFGSLDLREVSYYLFLVDVRELHERRHAIADFEPDKAGRYVVDHYEFAVFKDWIRAYPVFQAIRTK